MQTDLNKSPLRHGETPATQSLFHYTTAGGLLPIVRDGKIWASEASSLNDVNEIGQGWEKIEEVLESFPQSRARDLLANSPDRQELSNSVFVLSASKAKDDVNQWDRYADGGRGYALEIDSSVDFCALSRVGRESPQPSPSEDADRSHYSLNRRTVSRSSSSVWGSQHLSSRCEVTPWLDVLYDDQAVKHKLDQLIQYLESQWKVIDGWSIPEEDSTSVYEELRDEAYGSLAKIVRRIKSIHFLAEREARVVATFAPSSDAVDYRVSAVGLVGYATLTPAPQGHDESRILVLGGKERLRVPVRSILLGPAHDRRHKKTVEDWLRQLGMDDVHVECSKAPLRPTR